MGTNWYGNDDASCDIFPKGFSYLFLVVVWCQNRIVYGFGGLKLPWGDCGLEGWTLWEIEFFYVFIGWWKWRCVSGYWDLFARGFTLWFWGALHITELIVGEDGNTISLGKYRGNIPISMQAALLKYITSTFLYMYSACFEVFSPTLNVMVSQPWYAKENPIMAYTFFWGD